jgi:hypothetical protein
VAVHATTLGPRTVSRLALGAMLMRRKTSPDEAERILDRYLASGGNFIESTPCPRCDAGTSARRGDHIALGGTWPKPISLPSASW